MAERIEDLFAEFRVAAVQQVQPPGTEQVRRTVRRRRSTTAFAGVLLVAFGVTVTLLGMSARPLSPATGDPLVPAGLAGLARLAQQTVTAGNPGPALFARGGTVTGPWSRRESVFLGEIDFQLACAGTGTVTLLVRGIRSSEDAATDRPEVARITAVCSAEPVPARTSFVLGQLAGLTVELTDMDSALDRAGFAYRATSDTGEPASASSDQQNTTTALRLPDPLPAGSGWGYSGGAATGLGDSGWEPLDGDFRLAVACRGTGTLRLTVRQARSPADPEATVVASKSYAVACRYPPQRQDLVVGRVRDREVQLAWRYESTSAAPADFSTQFLPR